ncbi:uncharacterized protein FIBRA_02053 [Fibroporia radiculosa]|uniref:tRNA (guanine(37)-N1)-methyltransferase n=1 Tax=Fibroporia radiculosa TaxID=599839 RepID=J4HUA7_9APHY|nr:uncharacterized protein FIBRA_02053 [Fibroporia radiculosa]CCM00027.1 predicted protein [Fibroporia radiculosa]
MSRKFSLDVSPPVHRGMAVLDRDAFRKEIPILAAKVSPAKAGKLLVSQVMKRYVVVSLSIELVPMYFADTKSALLDVRRVKSVAGTDDGNRLVLLNFQDRADLSPDVLEFLKEQSAEIVSHTLHLNYGYWTSGDILAAVLPEDLVEEAPSGFAAIGHIGMSHLNLNSEYLPYKHLIGQVILDKNSPHLRTVVNKLDSISNQFRVFKMELLAGEPDYIVQHHESNCQFTFDFSEVYWNSRLHTEHARLVDQFSPEDVVADVFAGVGPFAIPAAKKGCAVFANDLNPESHKYLLTNIADNKVSTLVQPSCEDGRAFIRAAFNRAIDDPFPPVPPPKISKTKQKQERAQRLREDDSSRSPPRASSPAPPSAPRRARITHFSMNLPELAIEFLDAFRGVLAAGNAGERPLSGLYGGHDAMPWVHCYCFTRELEPEKAAVDIRQRVEERLGHAVGQDTSFYLVRSVAPNKDMYCVSFRLPYDVAFAA